MRLSKTFISLSVMFAGGLALVPPHPEVLAVKPLGNIAAVQGNTVASDGDSRLYYQNADNSITELALSNSLNNNHTTNYPGVVLVPGDQVLKDTPIAAVGINNLEQIRVYFLSPSNVLSEYIWNAGWQGGPSCTQCLTASSFVAAPGSQILYAMANPDTGELRVGFVSAGSPTTVTEAGLTVGGEWKLGQL